MTNDDIKIGLSVKMTSSWKREVCRNIKCEDRTYNTITVSQYGNCTGKIVSSQKDTRDRQSICVMWDVRDETKSNSIRLHYAEELDMAE